MIVNIVTNDVLFEFYLCVLRKLRGTIVNIIFPPRVSCYCREIYFTAASFISPPRVLFYCREIYFIAASFILLPRDLFYHREFYFHVKSRGSKIKLGSYIYVISFAYDLRCTYAIAMLYIVVV